MGDDEKQDFGKVDHPTQAHMLGDNVGQVETMADNAKQLETTGDKDRQEGRQGETRPREGGHTLQHRHTCGETMERMEQWEMRGDKTLKRRAHHPSKGNKKGGGRQKGRQGLGKADTPSNTNAHGEETMGDKGRQDLGKADKPSNTGRQDKTPPNTGTHVGRQWETKREDKTSKRRTHHPTQAQVWETMGDNGLNGREGETRPREGGRTIQHRHTWGDNGRQFGNKHREAGQTIWGGNGRQWEIRLRQEGHTIQHRHTCGETMGENGEQWGTRGHTIQERETRREVGDNGRRQGETRPWEGGHTIQHKRIL